jgi:RNA-directed DNA polymerase
VRPPAPLGGQGAQRDGECSAPPGAASRGAEKRQAAPQRRRAPAPCASLSNLAFLGTDRSLAAYARSEGLSFTRYVDDLTFSGDVTDRHSTDIARILDDAGCSVNTRKTAFMRRGGPQYVTGLYVGESDGPRIPRALKFGGENEGMYRRRLLGWPCYIAAVEPNVGFPLLREFDRLVPEGDDEELHGYEEDLYDLL